MTVLLLEDQPLIAMDTEAILVRAGFVDIHHFAAVTPTLEWLDTTRPDLVVMEIMLQNEPCVAIAEHLRRQNVPFMLYTGANRQLLVERIFDATEWVSKPSELEILNGAIDRVLGTV